MFQRLDAYFKVLPGWKLGGIGLLAVALVGLLDHVTGFEMSFSVFYLLPISLNSWYGGRRLGFALCFLSAWIWLLMDLTAGHLYRYGWFLYWNTGVRLAFFLVTAHLITAFKSQMLRENELARKDALTGIANSRGFMEATRLLLKLTVRSNQPITLGYIDLDNFKAVNDRQGHAAGDQALQAVGKILAGSARSSDVVGRLGGDEFAVLLPDTGLQGAKEYFYRVHAALLNGMKQKEWPVGFSIGVAVFPGSTLNENEALKYADNLMYRVKSQGKNSILFEVVSKVEARD